MAALARRIYRALLLTGYARIDVRLRPDGSVFVLEANANPNLEKEEDFATSAQAGGVGLRAAARADHALGYGLRGRVAPDLIAQASPGRKRGGLLLRVADPRGDVRIGDDALVVRARARGEQGAVRPAAQRDGRVHRIGE